MLSKYQAFNKDIVFDSVKWDSKWSSVYIKLSNEQIYISDQIK